MVKIFSLQAFIKNNSIVQGKTISRTLSNGETECGLCLFNASGEEFFISYSGTEDELKKTLQERKNAVRVMQRDNDFILCFSAYSANERKTSQTTLTTYEKSLLKRKKEKTNEPEETRCIGILKWYDSSLEKRYGVITYFKEPSSACDVFLHHSGWCDAEPIVNENQILIFDCKTERGRKTACNCRYLTANDDWTLLEALLKKDYIDILDRRNGRTRVYLYQSLFSTLDKHRTLSNQNAFRKKIADYKIELTLDQKKTCLVKGLLPTAYFQSELDSLVEKTSINELLSAIKNSDDKRIFTKIIEQKINKLSENQIDFTREQVGIWDSACSQIIKLDKLISALNEKAIQCHLYGRLLSCLPSEISSRNIVLLAKTMSEIWENRNHDLPIHLLNNYPQIRLAVWFGGGKIPLDRPYLCHFIENTPWFLEQIKNYHKQNHINLSPLFSIAKQRLKELSIIKNDDEFQAITCWYNLLREWGKLRAIEDSHNLIANVLLWIDGDKAAIDMTIANKIFIYLKPGDQVRFIKRLIQKKALGDSSITIETFTKLTNADLGLYTDNQIINPSHPLDISTHVLIQLLKKFSSSGVFMVESELFQAVFSDKTKGNDSFKLKYYFDKCPGRCQQEGSIREPTVKTYYWFPREFCDAPKANKKDENGNDFFWCGNARCYKSNVILHSSDDWEQYSLWDIIHILNINTHYTDDDLYKNYITFIAQVNKYNQIAERLKCKECGELLYPNLPQGLSNYHYYSVTQYYCDNTQCTQFQKGIYLNHCFHPNCIGIIDSRESRQCANGRYICPSCASCCTDHEFDKAIQYKRINGGYIYHTLEECHLNHKGHNDKGIFFCYKCGSKLINEHLGGESVIAYKERNGYKRVSYGTIPCKNGYNMPVIFFDGNDFIALGKDIRDKSKEEILQILSDLRVVNGNPYKSIVHFSSLSEEMLFYCENCGNVKYRAIPYTAHLQNINPNYKHLKYTLEKV